MYTEHVIRQQHTTEGVIKMERFELRYVMGHIEVYDENGRFCFSADHVSEAMEELREAFSAACPLPADRRKKSAFQMEGRLLQSIFLSVAISISIYEYALCKTLFAIYSARLRCSTQNQPFKRSSTPEISPVIV